MYIVPINATDVALEKLNDFFRKWIDRIKEFFNPRFVNEILASVALAIGVLVVYMIGYLLLSILVIIIKALFIENLKCFGWIFLLITIFFALLYIKYLWMEKNNL